MDVYCPKCGEPMDTEVFHEEAAERVAIGEKATYASVSAEFRSKGCTALREFGARCNPNVNATMASAAEVAFDVLGDDMDGAASMLEDYEDMFG